MDGAIMLEDGAFKRGLSELTGKYYIRNSVNNLAKGLVRNEEEDKSENYDIKENILYF